MVDVSILFTLLAVLTDLQGMPLPGARGNHDLLLLLAPDGAALSAGVGLVYGSALCRFLGRSGDRTWR